MLAALALAAAPLAADVRTLTPGVPQDVAFGVHDDEPVFRVEVPGHATALRLTTRGANYDVDIFGAFGYAPAPHDGEWDVVSDGTWIDEELVVSVTDALPLEAGEWLFVVALGEMELETDDGARLELTVEAELLAPTVHELVPGRPLDLVLATDAGMRALLLPRVDGLPPGRTWRVEVLSPTADVDLIAGPGPPAAVHAAPFAASRTARSWEWVALEPERLEAGARLHVFAYPEAETPTRIPVRALLSPLDEPPGLVPPLLVSPPEGTSGVAPPFERAVAATVSVYGPLGGGSGVVVSPDGLVLTNAHVVVGGVNGKRRDELSCGFTVDPRVAPIPAFRLEVLDSRRELDLALVRIAGGLDGRPLPAPGTPGAVVFPTVDVADDDVRLGDTVHGIGFPMTGGSGSYVTVSITRGIVSGFAVEGEGVVLKTDAGIHSGVSGGACVDVAGRLIGVPSFSIPDANQTGGLGFVLPVALLPAEWRARIGGAFAE